MYDNLMKQFQDKLKFAPDFKKVVKFVVNDDDNEIVVDCSQKPPTILTGDKASSTESDVTMIASLSVFEGIMSGAKDPTMAFMTRQLKIKGSMGIAMKLNAILED